MDYPVMYILRSFCYNFSDSCLSSHTSHGLKTFDVDELAITCNRFLCYYLSKQSREMCTMSIFRIWSFAFCMLAYVSIICTQALQDCLAHRDCISSTLNHKTYSEKYMTYFIYYITIHWWKCITWNILRLTLARKNNK